MIEKLFYLGCDLGKAQDYSTLVLLEKIFDFEKNVFEPLISYNVTHLKRFALGTAYVDIVEAVALMLKNEELRVFGKLIVDASGVGEPVREMFVKKKLHPVGVYITGGTKVRERDESRCFNVPRQDLLSSTKILFEGKNIVFADGMDLTAVLIEELKNLDTERRSGGENEILWREKPHDDLVFALAVAIWWAARDPMGKSIVKNPPGGHDDEDFTNAYNPLYPERSI